MKYRKNIYISPQDYVTIKKYLEAKTEEEYQGEDSTIIITAVFPRNIEMDIKCCGCQDEPSWTEAVLFEEGWEVTCSEVEDEFLGEWSLEYNGNNYTAIVSLSDNQSKKEENKNEKV